MANETTCYLVVCPTKKRASALFKRLRDYIYSQKITATYLPRVLRMFTYESDVSAAVRFISQSEFYEASTGFHGFVVDETEVGKWLDATEK